MSTVTAGVAFVVVEAKAAEPALSMELFQSTILSTAVLIGFAVNLVIFGITFAFALYFQRVLSFTNRRDRPRIPAVRVDDNGG